MPPHTTAAVVDRSRPGAHRSTTPWWGWLLMWLLLLATALYMIRPVAGMWWTNWQQSRIAATQIGQQRQAPSATNASMLHRARLYNQRLTDGSWGDPWSGGVVSTSSRAWQDYASQLNQTPVMAQIRIPSIGVSLPVYHGTSDAVLSHGAGHVFGSSLPVGGVGTRAAIAAHTGEANMTGFDNLVKLRRGDVFFVDVAGSTLAYRVSQVDTVKPENVESLRRVRGQDLVTLVTCTPYGVNTFRLLVTGVRVPLSQVAGQVGWQPGFRLVVERWMVWWLVGFGVAFAGVVGVPVWRLWVWWRGRRRARRGVGVVAVSSSEDM